MVHTNCQFRGKHTVGGIVFYKHAFLVLLSLVRIIDCGCSSELPPRGGSGVCLQTVFWVEILKMALFFYGKFSFCTTIIGRLYIAWVFV